MSGETTTTVIGNLTSDPELRQAGGAAVANFTIASTPRTFDAESKEWKDGDTLFLRSTVWREAAEHVAASLTKGSRVVATGRLKPRTYETKTGEKRTTIEFDIDEIGISLRYSAATATGSKLPPTAQEPRLQDKEQTRDDQPAHQETPRIGWRDRLKAQQEAAAAEAAD
ncbi:MULTISPECIES: single-stranded DNA-binding protein [unclassified Arthrobacter]|uniref:single-stranded DNA-binding protein n=1 Tax=Micrococcaceae TaxID=1268 RepID=UPI001CC447DB|nr:MULTISPECIES: single-stranded DNA-binding protein [unclassified Arthrobacter]BCW77885.1 hypothetical protein NicSoilB11_42100 [Arthrobacter sp. NicSoilB11]GIU58026.1 hypothetical protein NicSoilC12_37750 [Arthrobacter sp. NicSoilC12]